MTHYLLCLQHEAGIGGQQPSLRSSALWSDFAAGTGIPPKAPEGGAVPILDSVMQDVIAKQVSEW